MDNEEQTSASFTSDKIPPFIKVKWESGHEDIHYSFLYEGTPEELRIRYEKELNETPENREKGLSRLKEVIRREKLQSLDDNMLLAVLRASKFDLIKAESKLRKFIVQRRELLKKLAKIDMDVVNMIYEDKAVGALPYRDKHGRVILYTRPYGFQSGKFSMDEGIVVALAGVLFSLSLELSSSAGHVWFMECETPSTNILVQASNTFRKILPIFVSFPLRLAKVEVLNEFSLVRWIFKITRPLLPDKLAQRFDFKGPHTNLIKSYHPDLLPQEFGGNMKNSSNDFMKKQLLDFIVDLREEAKSMPK